MAFAVVDRNLDVQPTGLGIIHDGLAHLDLEHGGSCVDVGGDFENVEGVAVYACGKFKMSAVFLWFVNSRFVLDIRAGILNIGGGAPLSSRRTYRLVVRRFVPDVYWSLGWRVLFRKVVIVKAAAEDNKDEKHQGFRRRLSSGRLDADGVTPHRSSHSNINGSIVHGRPQMSLE